LVATAVVAVALIAGSFVLVSMLSSRLSDTVRTSAQTQADQVAAALAESGVAALRLPEDDDRLIQVLDGDNEVVVSSSEEIGPGLLSDVAPGKSAPITVAFDDDGYLAVATVTDTSQGRYTVVAAHALDQVAESRGAHDTAGRRRPDLVGAPRVDDLARRGGCAGTGRSDPSRGR